MKKTLTCNYCNGECEWVSNKEVYGKKYGKSHMIWLCRDCDAYVGCHNNSKNPMGTLANRKLRQLRKDAKNLFISKCLNGNRQYNYDRYCEIASLLNKKMSKTHFAMFNEEDCQKIIHHFTK